MIKKTIHIGTRESPLAVWQSSWIKNLLAQHLVHSELVYIKSEGDMDVITPLYEMGIQGIFTRALDIALLKKEIDVAVHSLKDVPTVLAKGLKIAAVLPRAAHQDVLVLNKNLTDNACNSSIGKAEDHSFQTINLIIATSSIRRKAQWLHRFPDHQLDTIRGNINTRLEKLHHSSWNAAIFAKAGLERMGILPDHLSINLQWMLPAPAQGAICVVCREPDTHIIESLAMLNDPNAALCTSIERAFLQSLSGGCSTPISAYATVVNGKVHFVGQLLSPDGKNKLEIEKTAHLEMASTIGEDAAKQILDMKKF